MINKKQLTLISCFFDDNIMLARYINSNIVHFMSDVFSLY